MARRQLVPFVFDANGNGVAAQHVIILTAVSENAVQGHRVTRTFRATGVFAASQLIASTFRLFGQHATTLLIPVAAMHKIAFNAEFIGSEIARRTVHQGRR